MCKICDNDKNFKKYRSKRYFAHFDISYGSIPSDALDSLVKRHFHRYKVRFFVD